MHIQNGFYLHGMAVVHVTLLFVWDTELYIFTDTVHYAICSAQFFSVFLKSSNERHAYVLTIKLGCTPMAQIRPVNVLVYFHIYFAQI